MSDEPAKTILGDTAISAIERKSGRRWFGRRKDRELPPFALCENCGTKLTGHYCSQCGQAAVDYRRSFRHVIGDILDSFDIHSKIFGTALLLITRPWALTNEYLSGKRVRHLNPFKLYLFASIGFFFLVHYWTKDMSFPGKIAENDRTKVAAEIEKKRDEIETELEKENLSADQRRKAQAVLDSLTKASPSATAAPEEKSLPNNEKASPKPDEQNKEGDYGLMLQMGPDKPSTPFEKWLEAKAREKLGEHGSKADLFFAALLQIFPYMILCCIPLFALVLKLLYIRRGVSYIDHLIYALHIHTFAFVGIMVIVSATIGLNHFAPGLTRWAAILWIVFTTQILLSIRRVYRQGWFISILKFLFGGFIYLFVLVFAVVATSFITLAIP